jgi:H+/gluconate symporter-like permease
MPEPDELMRQTTTAAAIDAERRELALGLAQSESQLAEQARLFVPLVALALIVAMPVWMKSFDRFLKLLASPFVLLPVGFCIAHLVVSWRKLIKMRQRMRELEQAAAHEPSGD